MQEHFALGYPKVIEPSRTILKNSIRYRNHPIITANSLDQQKNLIECSSHIQKTLTYLSWTYIFIDQHQQRPVPLNQNSRSYWRIWLWNYEFNYLNWHKIPITDGRITYKNELFVKCDGVCKWGIALDWQAA